MIHLTGHRLPLASNSLTATEQHSAAHTVTSIDAAITVTESSATEKNTAYQDSSTSNSQTTAPRDTYWEKSSLDKALETLNHDMQAWATGLRFDIDPDTQRIILSIVDNETGEVIRSVPSEAVMAVAKMIAAFQGKGISTSA